jgi:CRP/FNR family cyclic AMP-dependent transcriptional regulator
MTHTGSVHVVDTGFLSELEPAARERLARLGSRRHFETGAPLFLEGDLGSNVIIVHSGRVKVFATDTNGHSVLLAVRGPGEILGDLGAIDGRSRSASGSAFEPVDAQVLTGDDFRRYLADTPGAALALLRVVIARLRDSDRLRVEFGAHDALGRVASRLVELAHTSGEPSEDGIRITLALSQDDLAQWVAASREAVARALASLRRRHLITTARREIIVTDLDGLRESSR